MGFGTVTEDSNAFTASLPGKKVSGFNVCNLGLVGQVNSFGNGIVGVFLEGGLHFDVPVGVDFVSSAENLF